MRHVLAKQKEAIVMIIWMHISKIRMYLYDMLIISL